MSDKTKIKVLKGVLVVGLDTIETGAECVIDTKEAEALVAAEIVEIVPVEKPAKAEKKAKEKDEL
jgi:hypothetical protein